MAAQPFRIRSGQSPASVVIQATPTWDEELRGLKRPNSNGSQTCIEGGETEGQSDSTVSDHRYRN